MPRSHFSVSTPPADFGPDMITKPLGDPSVRERNILFTKRVDGRQLFRPYPWLLQEALIGGQDVTCVHIAGRSRFYVRDGARDSNAIDWRV